MGSIILSREEQQIFMNDNIVCHIGILEKCKTLQYREWTVAREMCEDSR